MPHKTLRRALAVVLLTGAVSASSALAQDSTALLRERGAGAELRAGDIVRLRIWREPDLSGDFQISEQGVAVFPKLGPRFVAGLPVDSLEAELIAGYREYLRNPSINVIALRRINVLGAVRNPGLYPVDFTMTIADAVALAGGATPQGVPDRVELLRNGERVTARLTSGTRLADARIQSGDQLYVPERTWVSRNSGVVAASISAVVSLFIALRR